MTKTKKNLIFGGAALLAVIVIAGFFYYQRNRPQELGLSAEKAGEKVMEYIAKTIPDTQASLLNIVEEKGLYKLTLKIEEQEFISYVTKDGKLLFPYEAIDLEEAAAAKEESESEPEGENYTIGNFLVSKDDVCQENGKPIVYFFGSAGCPHCTWEHPIAEKVASSFGEQIVFHNNMDSQNDNEVFKKYSTGGIPTLVLGCKYYRVGSGENLGGEEETKNLTALVCKLTNNQPNEICAPVQGLIDQI